MKAADHLDHGLERDGEAIAAEDDGARRSKPEKSLHDVTPSRKSLGIAQLDDQTVVPSGLHGAQAVNVGPVDSPDRGEVGAIVDTLPVDDQSRPGIEEPDHADDGDNAEEGNADAADDADEGR